jgi:hypothetical protein
MSLPFPLYKLLLNHSFQPILFENLRQSRYPASYLKVSLNVLLVNSHDLQVEGHQFLPEII